MEGDRDVKVETVEIHAHLTFNRRSKQERSMRLPNGIERAWRRELKRGGGREVRRRMCWGGGVA